MTLSPTESTLRSVIRLDPHDAVGDRYFFYDFFYIKKKHAFLLDHYENNNNLWIILPLLVKDLF